MLLDIKLPTEYMRTAQSVNFHVIRIMSSQPVCLFPCLLVHESNLVCRARLPHAFLRAHSNALRLTVWPSCDGDPNMEEQASELEPVNERVNINLESGACG